MPRFHVRQSGPRAPASPSPGPSIWGLVAVAGLVALAVSGSPGCRHDEDRGVVLVAQLASEQPNDPRLGRNIVVYARGGSCLRVSGLHGRHVLLPELGFGEWQTRSEHLLGTDTGESFYRMVCDEGWAACSFAVDLFGPLPAHGDEPDGFDAGAVPSDTVALDVAPGDAAGPGEAGHADTRSAGADAAQGEGFTVGRVVEACGQPLVWLANRTVEVEAVAQPQNVDAQPGEDLVPDGVDVVGSEEPPAAEADVAAGEDVPQ